MTEGESKPSSWIARRWPSLAVAAGLCALCGWAFQERYQFLFASPYPLGIDGYFYPIQLRSLLDTGTLYYPSAPLTLWLMTPLAALSDPLTGAKLGAALGSALLAIPIYFLGRRISGDRAIGLLSAALIVTSTQSFYLTVEFVKNGVALAIAATYLCALQRALDRPTRLRIGLAIAALVATILAHKLAAALAIVCSIPPLYVRLRGDRAIDWRSRKARLATVAGAATIAGLVILGALAPDRFIGGKDLALIRGLFSADPDFTLPALAAHGRPLRFGYEVAIAAGLALAVIALAIARRWIPALAPVDRSADLSQRAHDRALVVGPVAIALFLGIPWLAVSDPQALPFRLRLLAFVPLALCAARVAAITLARLSPMVRGAVIVGFAVGWMMSRPAATREGLVVVEPHMQAAMLAMNGVVPSGDVVICPERHIMFMITWYTGTHARLRPEPVAAERRWRLLPSALISKPLHRAIDEARRRPPPVLVPPRGLHPRHRNGVVLMPEATWQWVLSRLDPTSRAAYQRWRTI